MKAALIILFLSINLTGSYPSNITTVISGQSKIVFKAQTVLICRSENAYAYHAGYCRGLKQCKHKIEQVSVAEAIRLGFKKPCGYCY